MQMAVRVQTIVRSDGTIAIEAPDLIPGEAVEVIILLPEQGSALRRSALDILAEAPGKRAFTTADEVTRYLQEERDSWDR